MDSERALLKKSLGDELKYISPLTRANNYGKVSFNFSLLLDSQLYQSTMDFALKRSSWENKGYMQW